MKIVATLLSAFVALQHIAFLTVEMFFWNHPIGRSIFSLPEDFAAQTTVLAANQGLYNGFLAAGLIWALIAKKIDVRIFFLCCVIVAGIFGAVTVGTTILYVQALPALIALGLTWISRPK